MANNTTSIIFHDLPWPVQLTTSAKRKRLTLSIDSKGEVVVATPPQINHSQIKSFVLTHVDWIVKVKRQAAKKIVPIQTTKAMIFGQWYNFASQFGKIATWQTYGNQLIYVTPNANDDFLNATAQADLRRFFKSVAANYMLPRIHQLAQLMNTKINNVTLRAQKSRWGSCSSTGNINLNWQLVHFPTAIIDYVLIHELAHRTHMNHSVNFWALVAKHDPHHKQHRQWLRQHGITLP